MSVTIGDRGTVTIAIDGPGDLRSLGERLDWLRLQLSDLDEQKKRFLRHVSHELKTPLTSLREGAELLADGTAGPLSAAQQDIAAILRDHHLSLPPDLALLIKTFITLEGLGRMLAPEFHMATEAQLARIVGWTGTPSESTGVPSSRYR